MDSIISNREFCEYLSLFRHLGITKKTYIYDKKHKIKIEDELTRLHIKIGDYNEMDYDYNSHCLFGATCSIGQLSDTQKIDIANMVMDDVLESIANPYIASRDYNHTIQYSW